MRPRTSQWPYRRAPGRGYGVGKKPGGRSRPASLRLRTLAQNSSDQEVSVPVSLGMTALFLGLCLVTVWWIFKTGYRLKN